MDNDTANGGPLGAEPSTDEATARQRKATLLEDAARRMAELEDEIDAARVRTARLFRRRFLALLTASATVFALVGGIISLFALRFDHNNSAIEKIFQQSDSTATEIEIRSLQEQINAANKTNQALQATLAKYEAAVRSGQGSAGLSIADRQRITRAESSAADLDKRISSLEGALMQTPEKALSLPLLRQQLTDAQEKSKGDIDIVQGEINRVYGMMQWFLALMISTTLGVAGLVINSFRKSPERKSAQADPA